MSIKNKHVQAIAWVIHYIHRACARVRARSRTVNKAGTGTHTGRGSLVGLIEPRFSF